MLDAKRLCGVNSLSIHAQPVAHGQQALGHGGDDATVSGRAHVQGQHAAVSLWVPCLGEYQLTVMMCVCVHK